MADSAPSKAPHELSTPAINSDVARMSASPPVSPTNYSQLAAEACATHTTDEVDVPSFSKSDKSPMATLASTSVDLKKDDGSEANSALPTVNSASDLSSSINVADVPSVSHGSPAIMSEEEEVLSHDPNITSRSRCRLVASRFFTNMQHSSIVPKFKQGKCSTETVGVTSF